MNEDLKELFSSSGVEEEYIANFERQKVNKVSTLRLLTERSLMLLFPEGGPRLEFFENLENFKNEGVATEVGSSVHTMETISYEILDCDEVVKRADATHSNIDISVEETPHASTAPAGKRAHEEQNDYLSGKKDDAQEVPIAIIKKPGSCDFMLQSLCESTLEGKLVLAYYKENSKLNEKYRNELADICVKEYLKGDLNKNLTAVEEQRICDGILSLFPTEIKIRSATFIMIICLVPSAFLLVKS